MSAYPHEPGYKASGTSELAAHEIQLFAADLRNTVLRAIQRAGAEGLTADEAAAAVKRTPFSVRPRVTELKELGLILASEISRRNGSGRRAAVWVAVEQRPAASAQPSADDDLGGLFS